MPSDAAQFVSDRLRVFTVAGLLIVALYLPYYLVTIDFGWPIPRDGTTLVVGRDFLNFWMYGRAAGEADPSRYYDIATYWAAIEPFTGRDYPGQLWSYPPSLMLLGAPFGLLPYFAALALWTVIGVAVFVAAIRLWSADKRLILSLVLAPAAILGLISGQFAFVAAAVILAILRWRESRPVLAGILLGCLTLKPQLGLFFPLMLLAAGNWRVIFAAAITALGIAAATALIWGPEVWIAYFQQGIPNQTLVLKDPDKLGGPFMPTLFMNLRVAGASYQAAMAAQALAAAAAALLVWATFRKRPAETDLRANTIFLAAAVFGTPYMLSYDTLALTVMTLLLMVSEARGRILPLLVYMLPLIQLVAGNAGLPGPAIIPMLLAWHLYKRRSDAAA